MERDFFSQALSTTGSTRRKALVEPNHPQLSLVRQCQLLGMSRSSLYYQPVGPSEEELTLLRLIDEQYLKTPFYGSRRMTVHLRQQGFEVNRKRVQRLMHQLGLQAIYPPSPQAESGAPRAQGVSIFAERGRHCCGQPSLEYRYYLFASSQGTFLPGGDYGDWFGRKVLSWQVSNTMDVQFALDALEEALSRYAKPTIFNSDHRRSVYRSGVYRAASSGQYPNQHGWPWTLS